MRVKALVLLLLVPLVGVYGFRHGNISDDLTQEDRQEIVNLALDYVDGFYEGNAERMSRALHPDLAKRDIALNGDTQEQYLRNMTAGQLVDVTASGGGVRVAETDGTRSDVTILDTFSDMASVRIDAITWVDYLHVGKINGEWKIINVLWGWRAFGVTGNG